jgi:hypothetical protein
LPCIVNVLRVRSIFKETYLTVFLEW